MQLTPDDIIVWSTGFFRLTATLVYTWLVMLILVLGSYIATRNLSRGYGASRWQHFLEVVVNLIREQIAEIGGTAPDRYVPFIGSLFLFILVSNVLSVVPGFLPPTGSLNTACALAVCVFVAVPVYGISQRGVIGYCKNYIEPTPFMLPFNIIGEVSRTLALAVRLFGNMMSGTLIVAILLSLVPLFFPVVIQLLGLVTGVIQAYIFAVLAMVYIASAVRTQEQEENQLKDKTETAP